MFLLWKGKDKQFVLNDPEEFEELMDKELKSYLNCVSKYRGVSAEVMEGVK
jgi:hypothetical protein